MSNKTTGGFIDKRILIITHPMITKYEKISTT